MMQSCANGDYSCKENFKRGFCKFLSEPGRRVNLAAAQLSQHLSAMCGPLLSFSLPPLVEGVVWLCDTCPSGFAKDSRAVRESFLVKQEHGWLLAWFVGTVNQDLQTWLRWFSAKHILCKK